MGDGEVGKFGKGTPSPAQRLPTALHGFELLTLTHPETRDSSVYCPWKLTKEHDFQDAVTDPSLCDSVVGDITSQIRV